MNKGYKLFGGFIGMLLLIGVTAKANKTAGYMTDKKDSVQTKSMDVSVPEHSVIDEVVWVVGDEPIMKSDVEQMRLQGEMEGMKWGGNPDCRIPEQIAVQKLFLHQAALDSIEVTESDIAQTVEQQINYWINSVGSREKLEEYQGKSLSQIRSDLHDDVKNSKMIQQMKRKIMSDVTVTPADVRRYFKNLPEDSIPFVPTEVEVEILVKKPRIPQSEINRVKDQLRSFTDRVTKGETSFSTLARLYSEDPGSARQGGEMDYAGRGTLDPAFASVAFNLTDPKKISKIVESEFGYHIIQLVDKRGDKVKVRHILLKPKVSAEDLNKALGRLDSIAADIKDGKFTFEAACSYLSEDKDTRNNHGLMAYTDNQTGKITSRFQMKDLPTEVASVVNTMKVGEISAPFKMVDHRGKTVAAIIKLINRIDGHRAKITEDFQTMQEVVMQKESEKKLHDWVVNKIKNTYVRMNDRYKGCDFEYQGWIR
ncbi:peptidylprolyl isomerase [Segatella oris]|uniref:Peptidyl-prolyl cis-trans isomerase surA n=1 Tax=Segatella oris TaxID=28135 RepID=A0A3S4UKT7_9BACT|nr:peptidylprolyl isomerase [Segatella oris]VEH14713.1 Peptidyl-prolyl cis-trans isomerase surA [Segatella oris]